MLNKEQKINIQTQLLYIAPAINNYKPKLKPVLSTIAYKFIKHLVISLTKNTIPIYLKSPNTVERN